MKTPSRSIKAVAKAFDKSSRTSLYRWLYEHIDELPKYRRRDIAWDDVAQTLAELGLKGRDEGEPLNANMVRLTYHRVRRDKETDTRDVGAKPPPVHPPAKQAEGTVENVSRHTTGFDHDPHVNEDIIRRRFRGDTTD